MHQKFNEWPVVEIEGYPEGSVVAVPILAPVAEMVAAEATVRGLEPGVFLAGVIGAGLSIIRSTVPITPPPKFEEPIPGTN